MIAVGALDVASLGECLVVHEVLAVDMQHVLTLGPQSAGGRCVVPEQAVLIRALLIRERATWLALAPPRVGARIWKTKTGNRARARGIATKLAKQ